MKRKASPAPASLSAEGKALWERLQADYDISDSAGLALLLCVCESRQRITEMRTRIAKDGGAVIVDRFGTLRPHPGVAIEQHARTALLAAIRGLRLAPGDAE